MIETVFLKFSSETLAQLRTRIHDCLGRLTQDQIWMRNSDQENAVGNLALHLAGNVKQWIGYGIAGQENTRDRDAEFAARGGLDKTALLSKLDESVDAAVATLQTLPPDRLSEQITVQNYTMSVLEATYHVVEHFAQHTGQIVFATKLLTGSDLGYYAHLNNPKHHPAAPPSETTP